MLNFKNWLILLTTVNVFQTIIAGQVPGHKICLSKTCVLEAAKLLNTIDESVSPCDDFYQFSCGKWTQNIQLPEHKSAFSRFNELQDDLDEKLKDLISKADMKADSRSFIRNARNYHDSCLNTTRLEELGDKPLLNLLDQLGGWPLALKKNGWKEIDWTDIYLKLRKLGNDVPALFSISISPDLMNNTRRILTLDQPSFGLGSRDSVLKGVDDPSVKAYKNLMIKSALKLGAKHYSVESTFNVIFEFETLMANNSMAKEMRRNMTAIHNMVTIKDLIQLSPKINWLKLIKGFVSENITEDEEIVLYDTPYIQFLNDLLPTYSNRFLTDYLLWRVIKYKMSSLNEEWLQLKEQFDFAVSGTKKREPRWVTCISKTQNTFGIALSHLYIKNFFSDDDKEKASEMFTNVVEGFRKSLKENTWMGDETRAEALRKLDNMKFFVGYPEEMMNESKIAEYYGTLQMDSSDYFGNGDRHDKWYTDLAFSELRKPVDPYNWIELGPMAIVNAYYHPDKNLVVMPAGILQGVFFNKNRPNYLNYGSIAYVSGHEIIHGFDDGGRQFDAKGNLRNWWDNTTDQLYTEKAKCIINQYNGYKLQEVDQYLNGINTQGENIADNGGVLQSYRAYIKYIKQKGPEPALPALNYTPDQLFWISSAVHWCSKSTPERLKLLVLTDTHSPSKPRVNCVVSNSEEFSKAFKCPLGSPMNPSNKCNVW